MIYIYSLLCVNVVSKEETRSLSNMRHSIEIYILRFYALFNQNIWDWSTLI